MLAGLSPRTQPIPEEQSPWCSLAIIISYIFILFPLNRVHWIKSTMSIHFSRACHSATPSNDASLPEHPDLLSRRNSTFVQLTSATAINAECAAQVDLLTVQLSHWASHLGPPSKRLLSWFKAMRSTDNSSNILLLITQIIFPGYYYHHSSPVVSEMVAPAITYHFTNNWGATFLYGDHSLAPQHSLSFLITFMRLRDERFHPPIYSTVFETLKSTRPALVNASFAQLIRAISIGQLMGKSCPWMLCWWGPSKIEPLLLHILLWAQQFVNIP